MLYLCIFNRQDGYNPIYMAQLPEDRLCFVFSCSLVSFILLGKTSQETRFEYQSFINGKTQKKNKIENLTDAILVNVYIWTPCYFLNNILKTHQIKKTKKKKKKKKKKNTRYESN